MCKGARRVWLQSSDSLQIVGIDTVLSRCSISGTMPSRSLPSLASPPLVTSQLQLVDAWGSPLCLQNAAACKTAGYWVASRIGSHALYLYDCPSAGRRLTNVSPTSAVHGLPQARLCG